jgi:hypothetical protein
MKKLQHKYLKLPLLNAKLMGRDTSFGSKYPKKIMNIMLIQLMFTVGVKYIPSG